MSIELQNKRATVWGASGRIESPAANALAAAGAHVARLGRSELDVLDAAQVTALFEKQTPFDQVAVTAATTEMGSVTERTQDGSGTAMRSKFFADHFARRAKTTVGSPLTLVWDFLSTRPSASAVLHGAIDAALEALAPSLAFEKAPVRVNVVSPGLVATPLWSGMADADWRAMHDLDASRLSLISSGV